MNQILITTAFIISAAAAESDGQLVNRAFQLLSSDPAKAANVARGRLQSPAALPDKHRAALLWVAGSGLALTGQHAEAMQELEEAECMAWALNDRRMQRRILRYLSASACELSRYHRGLEAAEEALAISRELNDHTAYVGLLHNELANNASRLGRFETAVEHYQAALKVAEQAGKAGQTAMVLANLAQLFDDHRQFSAAVEMHRRSLNLARQQNLPAVVATVRLNLGNSLLLSGETDEALTHFRAILKQQDDSVSMALKAGAEQGLGDAVLAKGDREQAQIHFQNALAAWTALQDTSGRLAAEQRLAAMAASQTDSAESLRRLEVALEEARSVQDPQLILNLLEELTTIHLRDRNWQTAAGLLQETQSLQASIWQASVDQQLATIQAEIGVMEQLRANEDLTHQLAMQQRKLAEKNRLTVILLCGLTAMGGCLLLLWHILKGRRKVITNLIAAEAEIRRQKQIQLDMERRIAQEVRTESLGLLAAGLAHDFNNLLTVIAGLSDLGFHSEEQEEKNQFFVEISATTVQASELTAQLLQFFGRSEGGDERTDLSAIVASARTLLGSMVRSRGDIRIECDDGSLPVNVREVSVRQILVNLVSNAADALSESGLITLSTGRCRLGSDALMTMSGGESAKPGEFCFLRVQDTGNGIAPEILMQIFDPYFSTKSAGRGLGLASVMGIVRSCHGAIEVQSTLPAESASSGTTVSIYLPAVTQPADEHCAAIDSSDSINHPVRTADADGCVLLVDDEEMVLRHLSRILQAAGNSVLTAASARQALELLRDPDTAVSCVVSDFTMPGEDGLWLAQKIRSDFPNMPIIICSGYGPEQIRSQPAVSAFLQKPFFPRELVQLVQRLSVSDPEQS